MYVHIYTLSLLSVSVSLSLPPRSIITITPTIKYPTSFDAKGTKMETSH